MHPLVTSDSKTISDVATRLKDHGDCVVDKNEFMSNLLKRCTTGISGRLLPRWTLSSSMFAEAIPRSLQSPLDSGHHDRTIGARQDRQFRCSLQLGQKLCCF
jgi:hypothetical protein